MGSFDNFSKGRVQFRYLSEGVMRPAPPSSETLTRTNLPGQRPVASSSSPPPLPAGATLGRYVVLNVLGEGGMGVVYAAHDFVLDRRVAVKLVRPDLRPSEREVRKSRLVSEAQAVARLSHPNVISVYDVGEFGGEIYIAVELVAGLTLQDWLCAQRRSLREVLDVFIQAGRGLAAAHRAGLIHRDFKPHNVLVGSDGRVRVTDFGLAVSQGTVSGDGAGTPAYMAPEQATGEGSPRADQYSFAVALQEAVTGARPDQEGATATAPRWLRAVIARALLPVEERFPSMDEMLEALERGGRSQEQAHRRMSTAALVATSVLLTAIAVRPPAAARAAGRLEALAQRMVERVTEIRFLSVPVPVRDEATAARSSPPAQSRPADRLEAPGAVAVSGPAAAAAESSRARPAPSWRSSSPAATQEQRDPSWVAALERLARLLRDLGLVDDSFQLRRSPEALASLDGEQAQEPTWAPLSWMFRQDPRATFSTIPQGALASSARVSDLENATPVESPVELAEARFALAQTLWDSDRERALRLVEQARAALEQDDATASTELLGKITEWLRLRQAQ